MIAATSETFVQSTVGVCFEPLIVTEMKTAWIPYPPEIVSDWTGWTVEAVRKEFGDTVLVRHGLSDIELKRGEPDPAQVRAEVTDIIARARSAPPSHGLTAQAGHLQDTDPHIDATAYVTAGINAFLADAYARGLRVRPPTKEDGCA